MSYSLFRRRYEGNILLGKADTAFSGLSSVCLDRRSPLQPGQEPINCDR